MARLSRLLFLPQMWLALGLYLFMLAIMTDFLIVEDLWQQGAISLLLVFCLYLVFPCLGLIPWQQGLDPKGHRLPWSLLALFVIFVFLNEYVKRLARGVRAYRIATADTLDARLCTSEAWHSKHGGIYFQDGGFANNGSVPSASTFRVGNCIADCQRRRGEIIGCKWYSCSVAVRPLFACVGESPCQLCAWAVSMDGSDPSLEPPCSGRGSGLCGWEKFVGGSEQADLSRSDFQRGLQAVAEKEGLPFEPDLPALQLEDPAIIQYTLWMTTVTFLVVAFLACPFGYLMAPCLGVNVVDEHIHGKKVEWIRRDEEEPEQEQEVPEVNGRRRSGPRGRIESDQDQEAMDKNGSWLSCMSEEQKS